MVEYTEAHLDFVFSALGDPTRRAIISRLREGSATVTKIAALFPVSLNAVSKHLRVLERAGLIRREIQGREHRCFLEAAPLQEAAAWTEQYRTFWEGRIDALESFLREKRMAQRGRGRR